MTTKVTATPEPEEIPYINGLFTPPDIQVEVVRLANQDRGWEIPEEWFTHLGPPPPWPSHMLACVVLEIALSDKDGVPGYIRTVRELWDVITRQHGSVEDGQLPSLPIDADHLRRLPCSTVEPGLRWRVLDFMEHWEKRWGVRPVAVRHRITSPNVDAFAALAHHPEFVRRMDGEKIPYPWIPGFEAEWPEHVQWLGRQCAPFVENYRGRLCLRAESAFSGFPDFTVPVRLEVR